MCSRENVFLTPQSPNLAVGHQMASSESSINTQPQKPNDVIASIRLKDDDDASVFAFPYLQLITRDTNTAFNVQFTASKSFIRAGMLFLLGGSSFFLSSVAVDWIS